MYSRLMSVWVLADGEPQVVRADSIVALAAREYEEPGRSGITGPQKRMRIMAAASAGAVTGQSWIPVADLKGSKAEAGRVIAELVKAIAEARQELAGSTGVLYLYGPPWQASAEIPKKWLASLA